MRSSLFGIYLSCALLMIIGCCHLSNGKVYERCELARLFRDRYALSPEEIGNWICIAKHHSGLNSTAIKGTPSRGAHGLFQISDEYWCSPPGHGFGCNIPCDKLRDDDFTDDFECLKIIRDEHKSISGDGYNAWSSYQPHCKGQWKLYIKGCFFTDIISSWRNGGLQKTTAKPTTVPWWKYSEILRSKATTVKPTILPWWRHNDLQTQKPTAASWKIYDKHSKIVSEKPKTTRKPSASRSFWKQYDYTTVSPFSWKHQNPAGVSWLGRSRNSRSTKAPTTTTVRTTTTQPPTTTQRPATTISHWLYPDPLEIYKTKSLKGTESVPTQPPGESEGKVYDNCELAWELYNRHNIPFEQIAMWVCIAQHESNFNTSAVGRLNKDGSGDHGLFQISDEYWCSPPGNGYGCGLSCSKLKDSDITDDVECMRRIYDEHQQISGDGFSAWTVYDVFCKGRADSYIDGCFDYNYNALNGEDGREPSKRSTPSDQVDESGKVYEPCGLADELRSKYAIPEDQIATWVCIAKHESNLDTAALGHIESEGLTKHGLFQIRENFWCSVAGNEGKCHKQCSDYRDSDISDDVECVMKIFDEQQSISGNGFHAWPVYKNFCESDASKHIKSCDLHHRRKRSTGKTYTACQLAEELRTKFKFPEDEIARWVCIAKYASNFNTSAVGHVNQDGSGNHGLFQISDKIWCSVASRGKKCHKVCSDFEDDDITDDVECVKTIFAFHQNSTGDGFSAWSAYDQYCGGDVSKFVECDQTVSTSPKTRTNKVYTRCELAQELRERHSFPIEQIATWVCIAERETRFRTNYVSALSKDGYQDHGMFAINDRFWCGIDSPEKGCMAKCSDFEDDDITEDVACIKKIFDEHQGLSGDGFNAWSVYRDCHRNVEAKIKDCFDDLTIIPTYKVIPREEESMKPRTNKVYTACELARTLRDHGANMEDIPTWVCIAKYESNFSTAAVAVNRNPDASGHHGIFRISGEFWCGTDGPDKICRKRCSDFEDDDIKDDFLCAQTIFNITKNEKGNGFKAWGRYDPYCRDNVDDITQGCFDEPLQKATGKVFDACELAHELESKLGIPKDQIATWICIVQAETSFNTSAVSIAEPDGSRHHGLFHISDRSWCGLDKPDKGCSVQCSNLEDSDIEDDVACAKTIFENSKRLYGNGFSAWAKYSSHCKVNVDLHLKECSGNVIPNPSRSISKLRGKVYEACELAKELEMKHKIPREDIATWVCIMKHESNFNTSKTSPPGSPGSHGIFSVSDQFWCDLDGPGKGCKVQCSDLEDDDLTDDISCAKTIFEETQGSSGNGFAAWGAFNAHCKENASRYIEKCFEEVKIKPEKLVSKKIGKVYERCELARELKANHGIPADEIASWICIVEHHTNYNTSLVIKSDADYTIHHGLFFISEKYWCGLDGPGKDCNMTCSDLEDDDISDDLRCARTVFETHKKWQKNGFLAWPRYRIRCKGDLDEYVKGCFDDATENLVQKNVGKVYEPCELAEELEMKHGIPAEDIPTWICIITHETNFNTSLINEINPDGSRNHGIFHISDAFWCGQDGPAKGCDVKCSDLEDGDITDDVRCAKTIHESHGFALWAKYHSHCKGDVANYIKGCKTTLSVPHRRRKRSTGKVYSACELAEELRLKHKMPLEQIATWVCIAHQESNFRTSAVGRLNADGSGDHGIFQISDIYWCDVSGPGKGCKVACSDLEDEDLTDDVQCIKQIYQEHERLFGDGFHAWAVYEPYCKHHPEKYIEKCEYANTLTTYHTKSKVLKVPKKKTGKVYTPCELATELRTKHRIPIEQIPTWICIAKHESSFKTSAVGRLNADGSGDHGLFQISDLYWCDIGQRGKACNKDCSEFEDDDITDDVECIRTIFDEHQRLFGDGFHAWAVYNPYCRGNVKKYIEGCSDFGIDSLNEVVPLKKPKTKTRKVYSACELARELRTDHNIPMEQIATWVCIAERQSNFKTFVSGATGEHGIFQISEAFWCEEGRPGKACNMECSDFEDDDITDDVQCAKMIYEEHQQLSGDGFNAWTAYTAHCKGRDSSHIAKCFDGTKTAVTNKSKPTSIANKPKKTGRVYTSCELAKELRRNNIPPSQIATWVCIAENQSGLKASASTNTGEYGIFQISGTYWCENGFPGKGCNLDCTALTDDNLTDDIECVRTIYEEHQRLSGDGFNAWGAYNAHCKRDVESYIRDCFPSNDPAIVHHTTKITHSKSKTGKTFTACELAKELHYNAVPSDQIPTWICIAEHQSNYLTSASTTTGEHGIFQISETFWCEKGHPGKACNLACSDLEDDDISDDIQCAQTIYEEHERLSGNGFNAWGAYSAYCKGSVESYLKNCQYDKNAVSPLHHATRATKKPSNKAKTGKVYTACELAKELQTKHRVPAAQIPTWVCIAEHHSQFQTSLSKITGEHGIFQISDVYWCEKDRVGKACNMICSDLEDDDIADDVQCAMTIYDEHQRLSGNGFNAWAAYNTFCQSYSHSEIEGCFSKSSATFDHRVTDLAPKDGKKKGKGKVYSACELATELLNVHNLPQNQIATWVCIASHESNFKTAAVGRLNADGSGDHGLFQISDIYWCDTKQRGKACNKHCDEFEDNDISDDVECVRRIYDEHERIYGDGFHAWTVYNNGHCKKNVDKYIKGCFDSSSTVTSIVPTDVEPKKKTRKVYSACELAQELIERHKVPQEQVATWVCIAKHESDFSTSAVGRLNLDGSGDHGIFQISDLYWCDINQRGKACNKKCSEFEDDDIADDVECVRKIYEEHERIYGDGFHAWTVYNNGHCKKNVEKYVKGCHYSTNTATSVASTEVKPKKKTKKVYSACELAQELKERHGIPQDQVATWVCIAKHESDFSTSAVGRLNLDGSGDHGIFQISDLYWCDTNQRGKACNKKCSEFEDDDIADDVECVRKIYEEHERIYGDGFHAWTVYNNGHCKKNVEKYIKGCVDSSHPMTSIVPTEVKPKKKTKKIYSACELARELKEKHRIPQDQIATWICIAKHESDFSTSAVGRLNWDGSGDHGIFQISDIYWCDVNSRGKACNKKCSEFEDDDITDDVECVKKIYEEHDRLFGNGFHAWTVYDRHCNGDVSKYIQGCFDGTDSKPQKPTKATAPQPRIPPGKVYSPCELALELKTKHQIPEEHLATWVCIAKHESNYDTAALGYGDHGLFQISEIFWCSKSGKGKECNAACSEFRDSDITDDVACIKKIYNEHQHLSGNGFNAWTVYPLFCKENPSKYIDSCPKLNLGPQHKTTLTPIKPSKALPKTTSTPKTTTNTTRSSSTATTSKTHIYSKPTSIASIPATATTTSKPKTSTTSWNKPHTTISIKHPTSKTTQWSWKGSQTTTKSSTGGKWTEKPSTSTSKTSTTSTTKSTVKLSTTKDTSKQATKTPQTWSWKPPKSTAKPATTLGHSTTHAKDTENQRTTPIASKPTSTPRSTSPRTSAPTKSTTTGRSSTIGRTTTAKTWSWNPSKSTSKLTPTPTKSSVNLYHSTTTTKPTKTQSTTSITKKITSTTKSWTWKSSKSTKETTAPTKSTDTLSRTTTGATTTKHQNQGPVTKKPTKTPQTWTWKPPKSTVKETSTPATQPTKTPKSTTTPKSWSWKPPKSTTTTKGGATSTQSSIASGPTTPTPKAPSQKTKTTLKSVRDDPFAIYLTKGQGQKPSTTTHLPPTTTTKIEQTIHRTTTKKHATSSVRPTSKSSTNKPGHSTTLKTTSTNAFDGNFGSINAPESSTPNLQKNDASSSKPTRHVTTKSSTVRTTVTSTKSTSTAYHWTSKTPTTKAPPTSHRTTTLTTTRHSSGTPRLTTDRATSRRTTRRATSTTKSPFITTTKKAGGADLGDHTTKKTSPTSRVTQGSWYDRTVTSKTSTTKQPATLALKTESTTSQHLPTPAPTSFTQSILDFFFS